MWLKLGGGCTVWDSTWIIGVWLKLQWVRTLWGPTFSVDVWLELGREIVACDATWIMRVWVEKPRCFAHLWPLKRCLRSQLDRLPLSTWAIWTVPQGSTHEVRPRKKENALGVCNIIWHLCYLSQWKQIYDVTMVSWMCLLKQIINFKHI